MHARLDPTAGGGRAVVDVDHRRLLSYVTCTYFLSYSIMCLFYCIVSSVVSISSIIISWTLAIVGGSRTTTGRHRGGSGLHISKLVKS